MRTAMMAITTNNSISVKARRFVLLSLRNTVFRTILTSHEEQLNNHHRLQPNRWNGSILGWIAPPFPAHNGGKDPLTSALRARRGAVFYFNSMLCVCLPPVTISSNPDCSGSLYWVGIAKADPAAAGVEDSSFFFSLGGIFSNSSGDIFFFIFLAMASIPGLPPRGCGGWTAIFTLPTVTLKMV